MCMKEQLTFELCGAGGRRKWIAAIFQWGTFASVYQVLLLNPDFSLPDEPLCLTEAVAAGVAFNCCTPAEGSCSVRKCTGWCLEKDVSYSFPLVRADREEKKVQLDLPSEQRLGPRGRRRRHQLFSSSQQAAWQLNYWTHLRKEEFITRLNLKPGCSSLSG